ncbi:MAG: sugar transferase [Rhodobacterales bacterium]
MLKPTAGRMFWLCKRGCDIALSVVLLPPLIVSASVLLVLNPFVNPPPLFYTQKRMGKGCKPFRVIKFRSMICAATIERGHEDPIEHHRIKPFGRIIRKCRLDELPQIVNVLKGDMSLIGPRPDYFEHAVEYLQTVPGYSERFNIRPGISGLAQVVVGYVEGSEGTKRKVKADLFYIRNVGFRMESKLFLKTISTVLHFAGS